MNWNVFIRAIGMPNYHKHEFIAYGIAPRNNLQVLPSKIDYAIKVKVAGVTDWNALRIKYCVAAVRKTFQNFRPIALSLCDGSAKPLREALQLTLFIGAGAVDFVGVQFDVFRSHWGQNEYEFSTALPSILNVNLTEKLKSHHTKGRSR